MALGNNPFLSCFIIVLSRGVGFPVQDIIPFQFMPQLITDSKTANFNDVMIVARSSPIKNYSGSGSRIIQFALEFFAQPEQGLESIASTFLIKTRIDACRALTYPDYSGFVMKPPPRCIIRIGNQVAMLGVCRNVSVSYSGDSPWDLAPISLAHHATVSLTFEEAMNIPLSNTEVRFGLPISLSGNEFAGNFPTALASSADTNTSGVGGSVGVSGPDGDQGAGAIPAGYQD